LATTIRDVGADRAGDAPLAAVEDPILAVALGGGLEVGRV
jgi:hypothetical protein